jgi:hypothetical protein
VIVHLRTLLVPAASPSESPNGVLAMAAGIWHNNLIGAPVTRSLIAYDH